jgi:hypothetical protein
MDNMLTQTRKPRGGVVNDSPVKRTTASASLSGIIAKPLRRKTDNCQATDVLTDLLQAEEEEKSFIQGLTRLKDISAQPAAA